MKKASIYTGNVIESGNAVSVLSKLGSSVKVVGARWELSLMGQSCGIPGSLLARDGLLGGGRLGGGRLGGGLLGGGRLGLLIVFGLLRGRCLL